MPANRLARRRRRGLALFDVILAVGVVGVLIAGGVLLLQAAQERIKRNDTLSLVNLIRAEAVRIFAGRPTYDGLSMAMLEVRGSLPDDVIRVSGSPPTTEYEHAYDREVDVWPMTGNKQFVLALADLDNGPCGDILSTWVGKSRTRAGILSAGVDASATPKGLESTKTAWRNNDYDHAAPSPIDNSLVANCDAGDKLNDIYIRFQG